MDAKLIEKKILNFIPILKAMSLKIIKLDETSCILSIPLQPNINHKGTAFGGSLYTSCIAACYSFIYATQIRNNCLDRDLVIAHGEIKYLKPAEKDFISIVQVTPLELENIISSFSQEKRKRITLNAFIRDPDSDVILCEFKGEFTFVKNH